jgi:hypothetical protein
MEGNDEVARLGKQVRRLRGALFVGVSLLAPLLAVLVVDRLRVPREVQARGFTLVDEKGAPLARLARTQEGGVLVLESRDGSTKIFLGMAEDVTGLALAVNEGVRASLTVGKDGVPAFTLRDGKGRARIVSGIDSNDQPAISVWNAAGRLDFLVRPGHSPVLQVFDAAGNPVVLGEAKRSTAPHSERPDRE